MVADNKLAFQFCDGASAGDALGAKGFNVVVAVKRMGVKNVGIAVAAIAGNGFFLRAEYARDRAAFSSGVTGKGRSAGCLSSP